MRFWKVKERRVSGVKSFGMRELSDWGVLAVPATGACSGV